MPKNEHLATLAANIKQGVDARLKDLHTSLPGIIVSFDPATQLASVQPAIKRIFKTNDGEKELLTPTALPILINVPVQFPRGGGFSLTFPVTKGDECLLVFCERSIDNWHKFGGVKDPGAKRFHDLSDATAFVGISSMVNKIPDYDDTNVQLKKDDGSVKFTLLANGTATLNANVSAAVTAPIITLNGNTTINGTLDVTDATTLQDTLGVTGQSTLASVTSNSKNIGDTHTHSQGADSGSDTQQNTSTPL